MKKLLIPTLALFFLASCKKDSTTTNNPANDVANTITETDETGKTTVHHYADAINGLSSFTGNYVMNITSIEDFPNTIELIISDSNPIAVKTYTNTSGPIPLNILYHEYSTGYTDNTGKVTITSLTATNVKGTFSGVVKSSSATKTLSSGSFNVDISQ